MVLNRSMGLFLPTIILSLKGCFEMIVFYCSSGIKTWSSNGMLSSNQTWNQTTPPFSTNKTISSQNELPVLLFHFHSNDIYFPILKHRIFYSITIRNPPQFFSQPQIFSEHLREQRSLRIPRFCAGTTTPMILGCQFLSPTRITSFNYFSDNHQDHVNAVHQQLKRQEEPCFSWDGVASTLTWLVPSSARSLVRLSSSGRALLGECNKNEISNRRTENGKWSEKHLLKPECNRVLSMVRLPFLKSESAIQIHGSVSQFYQMILFLNKSFA